MIYIGKTKNLTRRDRQHYKNVDAQYINRAINKYGRSNFSLNIITEVEDEKQADYAEIDWIARARNSLGRDNLYNQKDGGQGGSFIMSENQKKKLSAAHKGKTLSEDHKQKLSNAHKGQIAWNKGLHTGNQYSHKIQHNQ